VVGKRRSLGRHRREDLSVRQTSILFQRCRFLTTEPFLAHKRLLFCTDLAYWRWGIDSAHLLFLESDFDGEASKGTVVSYKSLYTSCVGLHQHSPYSCQMSISGQHCTWINFVRVCPPVVSIMGWTAAKSVWRQASSERHPSWTLPNWSTHEHMHRGKCIQIYRQLWTVSAVNYMYSMHNTQTDTHISFFHFPFGF